MPSGDTSVTEGLALTRLRGPAEDGNGERRISAYISTRAALALDRLANSYAITKREMLERLVIDAEEKVLKKIRLDSLEGEAYLSGSKVTP